MHHGSEIGNGEKVPMEKPREWFPHLSLAVTVRVPRTITVDVSAGYAPLAQVALQLPYLGTATFVLMDPQERAEKVVARMMERDAFSHWLGIEVCSVAPGACELRMAVRDEMDNGFRITHGGISYCVADSALAFASNSHGIQAVSIETSVSHVKPVHSGDLLTATAEELSRSNRIAVYQVHVVNQDETVVALFKGTVFRTGKEWVLD